MGMHVQMLCLFLSFGHIVLKKQTQPDLISPDGCDVANAVHGTVGETCSPDDALSHCNLNYFHCTVVWDHLTPSVNVLVVPLRFFMTGNYININ